MAYRAQTMATFPTVTAIAAVTKNQIALETQGHGIFSKHLCEQLKEGFIFDHWQRNYITLSELFSAVQELVTIQATENQRDMLPMKGSILLQHLKQECAGDMIFFRPGTTVDGFIAGDGSTSNFVATSIQERGENEARSFLKTASLSRSCQIIKNYRIFEDELLTFNMDGHCKVVLAESNDRVQTKLVAKMSTTTTNATNLLLEMKVLEHLAKKNENDLIIKLIDWVENIDEKGNSIMILERGRENGDLGKLMQSGQLNNIDDLTRVSIAKNLLEIGQCLQKCGIVWGKGQCCWCRCRC